MPTVTATLKSNGQVLARTAEPKTVEGNYYFPPHDVNKDLLSKSETQYHCSWKGDATYWSSEGSKDVAWSYHGPYPQEARVRDAGIPDYYAFDRNLVEVIAA